MRPGSRIIVGVTGGIAAYKSVHLVRLLQQAGAEVRAVLTPAATRFVGTETFQALTRTEVPVEVFNAGNSDIADAWSRHIHWAEWADAVVVAPCTANTLAKLAHGLSDTMLTTLVLAARCPVLLCPTMDGGMYRHPMVRRNLELLQAAGFHVLEPESGYLASGLTDQGRLPEPETIVAALEPLLQPDQPLKGKQVLVTAGPTREHLDPVRFLSNPSSGKMGIAMADAAQALGAEVTLIHGPLGVPVPTRYATEAIVSAAELFEAVKRRGATADVVVMAAAVADFTPETTASHKVKKSASPTDLRLVPTVDILAWLGKNRRDGQVLIGFAMETGDLIPEARRKRAAKNADWILANTVEPGNSAFGADTNRLSAVGRDEKKEPVVFTGSKRAIAEAVLRFISAASPSA